jgi:transposase
MSVWESTRMPSFRKSVSCSIVAFAALPHRWVAECALGWFIRNRCLTKDHEQMMQNSETFIDMIMIRLIWRRPVRGG